VILLAIFSVAAFFAERLGRAEAGLVPLVAVETPGILTVGGFLGATVDEDATAPFATPLVK
jgi:hypothetical protein